LFVIVRRRVVVRIICMRVLLLLAAAAACCCCLLLLLLLLLAAAHELPCCWHVRRCNKSFMHQKMKCTQSRCIVKNMSKRSSSAATDSGRKLSGHAVGNAGGEAEKSSADGRFNILPRARSKVVFPPA
jgi:hypothetical protein